MIKEINTADMLHAIRVLIQNICTKVPDRAEYRTKISQVGTFSCVMYATAYAKTLR